MYSFLGYLSIVFLLVFLFRFGETNKLLVLIVGMICLTALPCPLPLVNSMSTALPCFYLLSQIKHFKCHIRRLKRSILYPLLLIVIVASLILFIHSPHFNDLTNYKAFYFFRDLLFATYFYLCFGFLGCYNKIIYRKIASTIFVCTLVLTFWGILNIIGGKSYFIDYIYGNSSLSNDTLDKALSTVGDSQRFRVTAMFLNAFDYGYICCTILLFQLLMFKNKILSKTRMFITALCCAFGAFACGSRSVLLTMIISVLVFVLFAYSLKKKIKISLIGIILIIVVSQTTGALDVVFEKISSMFLSSSNVEGSSMDGRILQIGAVLYHIKDCMFFGNGYGYFLIDMGWAEGKQALVDKDLFGIEGIYMNILLERGVVGLVFYYVFWLILLFYLFLKRRTDIVTSACAISLVICYMVFAHATGELNSLPATLFFIGICLNNMNSKKYIYDKI